jgi:hypothetical protein
MRDVRSSIAAFALLALLWQPGQAKAQAVGFAPNVGQLLDGVSLSATPVVSADRRYVRLSLGPSFQTINGFMTFPVPAAVGGGGFGRGGGGAGGLGGIAGGQGGGAGGQGGGLGGFANVPPGDLSLLEDDYMIRRPKPTAQSAKAAQARAARGKKPLPDPVIVPIKKNETKKAAEVPRG